MAIVRRSVSTDTLSLDWNDLRNWNNGTSFVEWLTPEATAKVKHMVFWFFGCPRALPMQPVTSLPDLKMAYETLERQIRVFTGLKTLFLVIEDSQWRGHSSNNTVPGVFNGHVPGQEDSMWREHLKFFESMKNSRSTVMVEVGTSENFTKWMEQHHLRKPMPIETANRKSLNKVPEPLLSTQI